MHFEGRKLAIAAILSGILYEITLNILLLIYNDEVFHGLLLGDIIDFPTPIVFAFLAWLFFVSVARNPPSYRSAFLFLAATAIWIEGYGIHWAADSISNVITRTNESRGAVFSITYFLDEVVGHYIPHIGLIAFSALITLRGWFARDPTPCGNPLPFLLGGFVYGVVFFAISIEGQTALLSLSVAVLFTAAGAVRLYLGRHFGPGGVAFVTAYFIAALCIGGWGIWHGGFPEPSFSFTMQIQSFKI